MAAPTKYPDWATDGTNTVAPPAGKVATGWLHAEQPPAGWFNWWQNLVGAWTRWHDTRIGEIQAELDDTENTIGTRVAFKDQSNTFTQPQTITGADGDNKGLNVTHEINADGHIGTSAGSLYALGAGGSVHVNADVDAGNNVLAGVDFKYKPPPSRQTFVPIFSGCGSAVLAGTNGTQVDTAGYKLKFTAALQEHVFPIVLPHGAVLTAVAVIVKVAVGTMTAKLNRRYNHQFQTQTGGTKAVDQTEVASGTWGVPGVGVLNITCNLSIDNRANGGGSEYLLNVISAANLDEIHAVRVVWTDPGPRNH